MTWPRLHSVGGVPAGRQDPDAVTIKAEEAQTGKVGCPLWGQPEALCPGKAKGKGQGWGCGDRPRPPQPGAPEPVELSGEVGHYGHASGC